jgi:hypothetical protein
LVTVSYEGSVANAASIDFGSMDNTRTAAASVPSLAPIWNLSRSRS